MVKRPGRPVARAGRPASVVAGPRRVRPRDRSGTSPVPLGIAPKYTALGASLRAATTSTRPSPSRSARGGRGQPPDAVAPATPRLAGRETRPREPVPGEVTD